MIKRFGFLFVLYILLELAVLILVGRFIGVLPTIGLVVLTMIIGLIILRKQRLTALEPMIKSMQQNQPLTTLPNINFCVLISGILLIIPGFISDIAGLVLLIPKVQHKIAAKYMSYFTKRAAAMSKDHQATIIQGDFKKKPDNRDE